MEAVTDTIPRQFVFDKKYKIQLYEDPQEGVKNGRIKTKVRYWLGVLFEDLNIHISTPQYFRQTVWL